MKCVMERRNPKNERVVCRVMKLLDRCVVVGVGANFIVYGRVPLFNFYINLTCSLFETRKILIISFCGLVDFGTSFWMFFPLYMRYI
jgi:hypothetical protein